jgi:RNA polymerase sigma-70 factor (ECF subfamily)
MAEIPATRVSLLVRLRDSRDAKAWREFVDLYAPLIYGYVRKQGLQDADAADLSQDVLGAVAGAVGELDYDPCRGAFRNWLFTVVRRKLSNWRRSKKCRPDSGGNGTGAHELLEQLPAPEKMEAEWQAEWERRLFVWACDQVRQDVRDNAWQAFWRTFIDGQPGKQVAGDLGMSVAAVYLARRRVLMRLQELILSVQEPQ